MKKASIATTFIFFLYALIYSFAQPQIVHAAITHVQTINTAQWNNESLEPSGIALLPNGNLMVCDSEQNEVSPYHGTNLWHINLQGIVQAEFNTVPHNDEPTGCAVNPANGDYAISADDGSQIDFVDLGTDNTYGTSDDVLLELDGNDYQQSDEEDIELGGGYMFIADGTGDKVIVISPGSNGYFDGAAPDGDDYVVRSINVAPFGIDDPEGITYDPIKNTLWVSGRKSEETLAEITLEGNQVQIINVSSLNLAGPGGLAIAPTSNNNSTRSLYIADRDSARIVEILLPGDDSPTPTITPTPEPSLTPTSGPTPTSTPEPTFTITPTVSPTSFPSPTPTGISGPGIAHEQSITAIGTNTSVINTGTVAGGSNQMYVVSIANRGNKNVTSVSGLGLTWTENKAQCSGRNQQGNEIWTAFGSPNSGAIQVNFAQQTKAAVVSVNRYSGVNQNNPVENPIGHNSNGENGACSGGTDNTTAQLALTSVVNGSVHIVFTNTRNKTISSADSDYSMRSSNVAGSGGDQTRAYIHDRLMTSAGNDTANHVISSSTDWVTAGIVLRPQ